MRSLNFTDNPNLVIGSFDEELGVNRLRKDFISYTAEIKGNNQVVIDLDSKQSKNQSNFYEFSPMDNNNLSYDRNNNQKTNTNGFSPSYDYTHMTPEIKTQSEN